MNYIEQAKKLRPIIEQAVQSLNDSTSLQAIELYPHWTTDASYTVDFKVQYGERLYKVLQAHTSQASWTPDVTPSLFTEVNETASGTKDNPIPYSGNMILEQGKYYSQNDVVYLCTRDTGSPVYHDLSALVGLYVQVA